MDIKKIAIIGGAMAATAAVVTGIGFGIKKLFDKKNTVVVDLKDFNEAFGQACRDMNDTFNQACKEMNDSFDNASEPEK